MITILRMAGRFFKTWFFPSPAHDAHVMLSGEPVEEKLHRTSENLNDSVVIAEGNDEVAVDTISDETSGDERPRRRNNLPAESQAVDSSVFKDLVKEPEGDSERMSRVRKFDHESDGE